MKLIKRVSVSILAGAIASTAYGQNNDLGDAEGNGDDSGAYAALGTTYFGTIDTIGVDAKLGYEFNKYFGVEAQGTLGLSTNSTRLSSSPSSATLSEDVDYSVGAFAVGRLPLSEKFELFARGGIHYTEGDAEINNVFNTMFDRSGVGLAVGAGVQYNFNSKDGIRAEYTYRDQDRDSDLSELETITLGYVRKF